MSVTFEKVTDVRQANFIRENNFSSWGRGDSYRRVTHSLLLERFFESVMTLALLKPKTRSCQQQFKNIRANMHLIYENLCPH